MSVVNPQYEDVESSSHSSDITVEVSSSIKVTCMFIRRMKLIWNIDAVSRFVAPE